MRVTRRALRFAFAGGVSVRRRRAAGWLLLAALLSTPSLFAGDNDWGPSPDVKPAYSVVYTGRLFGYFRYPDEQNTGQTGCPDYSAAQAAPQVRQFLSTLHSLKQDGGPPLILALGDSFAPELLARAMRDADRNSPTFGEMLMKDAFSPDDEGRHWQSELESGASGDALARGKVPSDNVACFLRLAGVNAVVPGEHDFYFGPDRVRELARFLAEPGDTTYQPVEMLAANLAIVTTLHNAAPRLPERAWPAAVRDALKSRSDVTITLPAAVMPWLRRVEVKVPGNPTAVYDCPASTANPRDFVPPFESGNQCTPLESSTGHGAFALVKPSKPSPEFLSYYTLDPGSNHALCVAFNVASQRQTSCKLFSVQYPLLQYHPGTPGATPKPYYLAPGRPGSPRVAVFGILDPSLMGYVGEFNDTYLNRRRAFDTKLHIGDPTEALRQILGLCAADPSCQGARKVLLAQMPHARAQRLGTALPDFDLILTDGDPEDATGEGNSSRPLAGKLPPYVLSPGLSFNPSRQTALDVNLRKADLFFTNQHEYLANRVYDSPVLPAGQPNRQIPALVAAVSSAVSGPASGISPEASDRSFEALALSSMQSFCGSDVALLQHRDVFSAYPRAVAYWPTDRSYGLQQLLDEVLWKGDFVFCLPVKGSTLKQMLDDSKKFDQQDQDQLSLETERGRGLSTMGIATDPGSNQPTIRGKPIDGNRLYGIAATDYLAFGDTGYPELQSQVVLPAVRLTTVGTLHRVTGLACERLAESAHADCSEGPVIASSQYFDPIAQLPFDPSAGLTVERQWRQLLASPFQVEPLPDTLLAKEPVSPESRVERRGTWWFTLQNTSAEYDLTFIGGSDHTVPANFSGINTFSQLSTPESSRIGIWTRFRGGYEFPRFLDVFMSGEEKYTDSSVRIPAVTGNGDYGPYQSTLVDNLARSEIGVLSKPLSRRTPVRALLSEDLLTQVATPFLDLQLTVPCTSSPGCTPTYANYKIANLGRNYLVMTRIGARWEARNNWFEAGREVGENVDTPFSYSIQDVGQAQPFSCALAGNLSLTTCIATDPSFTTQSKILSNLQTQALAGWFLDFHAGLPLDASHLALTIDDYGEVFDREPRDTSFDTRFYDDITVALKIPVWGNLTFAPQVESFFFQNKVVPGQGLTTNHYTFVTTSIKLEYAFDWHRGVGLRRALRFPSGISSAPSPNAPGQ